MKKLIFDRPGWSFYSTVESATLLGVSRSTFLAGVKSGIYPQPVSLSTRRTGFRVKEIRECAESLGR